MLISFLFGCAAVQDSKTIDIRLSTQMGDIIIAVDQDAAPATSSYFLELVDQGKFDGTEIYRVGGLAESPDDLKFIEGGMLSPFVNNPAIKSMEDTKLPLLTEVEHTQKTGLKIERGSVFLGRNIMGNGEALPDLVIALADISEFEYGGSKAVDGLGYPVFAKVIYGMDVVDDIARKPRNGQTHFPFLQGQILTDPMTITASRVDK